MPRESKKAGGRAKRESALSNLGERWITGGQNSDAAEQKSDTGPSPRDERPDPAAVAGPAPVDDLLIRLDVIPETSTGELERLARGLPGLMVTLQGDGGGALLSYATREQAAIDMELSSRAAQSRVLALLVGDAEGAARDREHTDANVGIAEKPGASQLVERDVSSSSSPARESVSVFRVPLPSELATAAEPAPASARSMAQRRRLNEHGTPGTPPLSVGAAQPETRSIASAGVEASPGAGSAGAGGDGGRDNSSVAEESNDGNNEPGWSRNARLSSTKVWQVILNPALRCPPPTPPLTPP